MGEPSEPVPLFIFRRLINVTASQSKTQHYTTSSTLAVDKDQTSSSSTTESQHTTRALAAFLYRHRPTKFEEGITGYSTTDLGPSSNSASSPRKSAQKPSHGFSFQESALLTSCTTKARYGSHHHDTGTKGFRNAGSARLDKDS